jgi:PHD/YefM family antitoxin component YafN of YafNO toxin-antitoxin module
MSTITLDAATDQRLAELRHLTGREPAEIIRTALEAYFATLQDEAAYLLSSPANAKRLMEANADAKAVRNCQMRELLPDND